MKSFSNKTLIFFRTKMYKQIDRDRDIDRHRYIDIPYIRYKLFKLHALKLINKLPVNQEKSAQLTEGIPKSLLDQNVVCFYTNSMAKKEKYATINGFS